MFLLRRYVSWVLYAIPCANLFLVPQHKKAKFITFRESILSSNMVTLKTLQRFAGKAVSLSLAIPSCKLYVREVFQAIAQMARSPKGSIKVNDKLSSELLL